MDNVNSPWHLDGISSIKKTLHTLGNLNVTETSSFPCLLHGHSPLAQAVQRQIVLVQKPVSSELKQSSSAIAEKC